MKKKELPPDKREALLRTLGARFGKNMHRHRGIAWAQVHTKLEKHPDKLWSLSEMERTGGEPDVVVFEKERGLPAGRQEYVFFDCAAESPTGRRSLCFDAAALKARKEHKPKDSAMNMAADMGIELLTEQQYRQLQTLGEVDTKTSSWVATPAAIRKLGGAIFCDRRYDTVFTYHNGAESYYAGRGFRGVLRI